MADPTSNPILTELQNLSPGAQQTLAQMHQSALNAKDTATPPPTQNLSGMPAPSMPSLQAPSSPNVSMAPPPTVAPPARGTLAGDQAERSRLLSTGSGISQIHSKIEDAMPNHPTLGKVLGWGAQIPAQIGEAAGSMLAPVRTAEMLLPGTSAHHALDLRNLNSTIGKESEEGLKGAQTAEIGANTAKTAAETAGLPQVASDKHDLEEAQVGNLKSEATDRDAGVQNPTLVIGHAHAVNQAIKDGRDPATDPLVLQYEKAIQSTLPGFNKPPTMKESQPIMGPDGKPHVYELDEKGNKVKDLGVHYEKPTVVNVNAGTAALDRETKQFGASHQKGVDAANAQLEKIEDARSMINGNAESQALGVPKVLTALVGGQGTGVRITTPELNAIAKARGLSGDVEGTLNKWAGQGSLTKTQQQQLTSIMDAVKQRIIQKQSIAGEALDKINGAGSRDEIVQADKEARQKLSEMEKGSSQSSPSGQGSGLAVSLKDARSLPQNRGKSDADITADIKAHGHEVRP
jgi:hypothetical protein